MAQLVKIMQCASRYQTDLLRYAHRFIWLRNRRAEQWGLDQGQAQARTLHPNDDRNKQEAFNDWLFEMQLKWASSTAEEQSQLPEEIEKQRWITELIREVNDLAFFFYRPVFLAKNAEIQLDSLLITSDTLWCILPIFGEEGSVFQEMSDRKWREIRTGGSHERLNPRIALKRTRQVIASFLKNYELEMDLNMVLYAPDSFIEFVEEDRHLICIDRRSKGDWHRELSQQSFLFKRKQFETVQKLLDHCQTEAVRRSPDLLL
ncbi:MAG: hypothetical protein ABF651_03295 [Sporolactobacillus sp.]